MTFEEFRKVIENKGLEETVNSLILHGSVFYFNWDDNKYYCFKDEISKKLRVHTKNIEIIGSAKLGFSLNQERLGKSFGKKSDIDVVVISDILFEKAWSELISIGDRRWIDLTPKEKENLKQCQNDIYWGYIRPDRVPGETEFSKWWWNIFNELSSNAEYEYRMVRGRLFKSWERVQECYSSSLEKLLKGRN